MNTTSPLNSDHYFNDPGLELPGPSNRHFWEMLSTLYLPLRQGCLGLLLVRSKHIEGVPLSLNGLPLKRAEGQGGKQKLPYLYLLPSTASALTMSKTELTCLYCYTPETKSTYSHQGS